MQCGNARWLYFPWGHRKKRNVHKWLARLTFRNSQFSLRVLDPPPPPPPPTPNSGLTPNTPSSVALRHVLFLLTYWSTSRSFSRPEVMDKMGFLTTTATEEIKPKKEPFAWTTIATMVAFLILGKLIPSQFILLMKGTATAIANHLFFVHFDHQPQDAIDQSTLNGISVAMAFIFKTCIIFAMMIAFTQLLWLTFRQRWLEVACIDSLSSSPNSLMSLLHFRAAIKAPVTWTIALLCWLAPITSIFPPGAISVAGVNGNSTVQSIVPTFNSSTNTSSLINWDGNAADCYNGPGQDMLRLTTLAILGGGPLPFSSPCAPNCTYDINFRGPAWDCQNSTSDPDNPFGPESKVPFDDATFINTEIINNVFWLWYSAELEPPNPSVRATQVISCRIYLARYAITVRFSDSTLFYDNVNITFESPWVGVNESATCITTSPDSDSGPFWDDLNIGALTSAVATQLNGNISYSSISPLTKRANRKRVWAIVSTFNMEPWLEWPR